MIVGTGDIASVLNDRDGALFFASGVSNSACVDKAQFARERELLMDQDHSLCCFYFSSIFTDRKDTPYFKHKQNMEWLVKMHFMDHNIIRLGNISFGVNPHTFLNALRRKQQNNEPFEIFDEDRFMINEKELLLLTNHLPLVGQNTINVFGNMSKVKYLLETII